MGSVESKSVSMASSESMGSFGRTGSFLEYDRVKLLLSRGDLIEVLRGGYRHWVFFESVDHYGNVMCFHITAVDDGDAGHGDTDLTRTGVRKEMSFNGKALLKYEPLEDILKDTDSPQPSLCRINNQEIMASEMLKTTGNQLPDLDQVFATLHRMKDTIFRYCLKSLNCEHYSTFWKYGIGWSSQVNTFKDIMTAALKTVSTLSGTTSHYLQQNGCFKLGFVCLLISAVSSMVAKVVEEEIDLTLKNLKLEDISRHSIAN